MTKTQTKDRTVTNAKAVVVDPEILDDDKHVIKTLRENGTLRVQHRVRNGRTKQEFKAECDINSILKKFRTTGALTHVQQHGPQYGIASGEEYADAMRVVATANTMYEELPSHIRKEFSGPEQFLDFVQDESKQDEVRAMFGENPELNASSDSKESDTPPPAQPKATDDKQTSSTDSVPSESKNASDKD